MKPTFSVAMPLMAAAGALANAHSNLHHVRVPVSGAPFEPAKSNAYTSYGCYSAAPNTTDAKIDNTFLSRKSCNDACSTAGKKVAAISPSTCFCGDQLPPSSNEIDLTKCDYPCNGFGTEACGGRSSALSVFNTGLDTDPDVYDPSSSSSSSSTSTATSTASPSSAPSTTTSSSASATRTVIQETTTPEKSSSGPNTAAIAGGVVVGVVVAAAIIGGIIFYFRRKRNAEIEEEHRRNAAVNAFISGSKPPSTSGGLSITDSRLDPVMAHRRLSDGSIADNQDYSRKILRVTNA